MQLENVRIVLHSPLYGGNVGSVCRAMANMGVADLAISAPCPLNADEARMMACHATEILENRTTYATLPEAIADCATVAGTSARPGLYRQHARTAREWMPELIQATDTGRVALVFGPEDNGLTNDELALCTHVIQIPTTEAYTSLNLAQSVLICCYELFLAAGSFVSREEKSVGAPSVLRERMFSIWRETLLQIGFMEEDKADHMMYGLRRVLARGAKTVDDVNIMMGVARQAAWAAGRERE